MYYSCGHTQRRGVGSGGQADDKRGALPADIVVTENLASVLLHNAVADAQAEAGSFADFFGGEERVENLVGMRDSVAVVARTKLRQRSPALVDMISMRAGRPTS